MAEPISLPVARGVWIARKERNRRCAVVWGTYAAASAGMSLYVVIGRGHLHLGDRLGIAGFLLLPALACLRVALGCAKAGLMIRNSDIVIRGPLKTWTVRIEDVEGFRSGIQPGAANGTPGVLLNVRNRRPIPIWTLGADGFVWNFRKLAQSFAPTVESLNALVGGCAESTGRASA